MPPQDTSTPQFTDVSNPAAFGVEWTAEDSGSRFQLVMSRGTSTLMFGVQPAGSVQWHTMVVANPDRFVDGPVTTRAQFHRVVVKWFEAAAIQRLGLRTKEKRGE